MAVVRFVVPTRGTVRCELAQLRERLAARERRHEITLGYAEGQPVASNYNSIALRFLQDKPRADYLLIIADDSAPYQFNPIDLVDHDKDIVLIPTPTWQERRLPPLQWYPCSPAPGQGLQQIRAGGGHLMLIARRVLEHPEMIAPFMDLWSKFGLKTRGEDQTFVDRALVHGFEVWCDLDKRMAHFKTVELCGLWEFVKGMLANGDVNHGVPAAS